MFPIHMGASKAASSALAFARVEAARSGRKVVSFICVVLMILSVQLMLCKKQHEIDEGDERGKSLY